MLDSRFDSTIDPSGRHAWQVPGNCHFHPSLIPSNHCNRHWHHFHGFSLILKIFCVFFSASWLKKCCNVHDCGKNCCLKLGPSAWMPIQTIADATTFPGKRHKMASANQIVGSKPAQHQSNGLWHLLPF